MKKVRKKAFSAGSEADGAVKKTPFLQRHLQKSQGGFSSENTNKTKQQ